MKFSTFLILPLAAAASAQVSPCPLSYSLPTYTHTSTQSERKTNKIPNSHRALHQNKVRDHQTALRQHHHQRGQGVPRPSRRAASSQVKGQARARARARGHRACQAKGATAARGRRGQGEQRVVALDLRAVRAVERFRVGVTAATTAARRGRRAVAAAARRLRPPAPQGRRGRARLLAVGRAVCHLPQRRPRRWCLTAGLL